VRRRLPRDGASRTRQTTILAVLGLVIAAAGLFAKGQVFGGDDAPAHAPKLTLEEVVVRNGPSGFDTVGLHGEQTFASTPTVDLTVLNRGDARALVTGAEIHVLASTELPVCYSQGGGDVPASAPETIVLPFKPGAGEDVVFHDLHQQAGPDQADRFVFRFRPDPAGFGEDQLYALRVVLRVSGGASIDAGSFVLALPSMLDRWGDVLPEDQTFLEQAARQVAPAKRTAITWCYRRNVAEVRRLTAMAGRRSPEVASLSRVVPAANWPAFASPVGPRDAALEIIDDDVSLIPEAVFAAQRTHDPAFVAEIRARGVQALLDDARKDLDDGQPELAVRRAQGAQQLGHTPEADDVLATARRRVLHKGP
jgi:hypothetical protein